jgi:hypothetical protein
MTVPQLDNCPMCNGLAELRLMNMQGDAYIRCDDCSISTSIMPMDQLIKYWNKRYGCA